MLAEEANLARDPGSSTHCIVLLLKKDTLKLDIQTWNVVRFHSSIVGSSSTIVQGCALGLIFCYALCNHILLFPTGLVQ